MGTGTFNQETQPILGISQKEEERGNSFLEPTMVRTDFLLAKANQKPKAVKAL